MATWAARSLSVFGLAVACFAFSPPAPAQDNQAGVTDRGKQFFSEAKAFRETPGWKKLEQVVAIATKLSGEAATQAEAAQHQRVIDARLETPAETAKYLADLAFNQTKGSDGPTGIVVEYTTHPGAVAAAAQLMPQEAKAQVGAMFEGNPQLRALSRGIAHIYVPAPGETAPPPGAQGAAASPAAPPGGVALPPASAQGGAAAPAGGAPAAAPGGGAAPVASPRPAPSAAGAPAPAVTQAPAPNAPSAEAEASDFAPRASVPAGYEPVAGGSRGCPTN